MADLELWRDEKFIARDEVWLRLARHLDPDIRRDMVGWMGWRDRTPKLEKRNWAGFADALKDYIRGGALVIDPFPFTDPISSKSDRDLLIDDAQTVLGDFIDVAALIRVVDHERRREREQRQR